MPQHIGNAGTKTMLGENVLYFLSVAYAERGKEMAECTEKRRYLFDRGQLLDVSTPRQMKIFLEYDLENVRIHCGYQPKEVSHRLVSHELTYIILRTQSQRLPQRRLANPDSRPAPSALIRTHSAAKLWASVANIPLITKSQSLEARVQASEKVAAEDLAVKRSESPPRINVREVADKGYRLM